jgi:hypothetical protein
MGQPIGLNPPDFREAEPIRPRASATALADGGIPLPQFPPTQSFLPLQATPSAERVNTLVNGCLRGFLLKTS